MLERKIFEDQGVVPGVDFVTADVTLAVTQQSVRVTANPTTGAIVVTLPGVAQAAGKMMAVQALDADKTNTITVQDQNDSEEWADVTLNGGGEGVLVYSDGRRWWKIVTDTSGTGAPTTAA